jgi:hypothetical protein
MALAREQPRDPWYGKPEARNPRTTSGRQEVTGDGMIGRFGDITQGDLGGDQDGVHALAEEPVAQESEHPE